MIVANKSNSNCILLVNRRWLAGFLALESLLLLSVSVASLMIISVWSKKQAHDMQISCQARQLKCISHHAYQATINDWQTLSQQYQPPIDLNHSLTLSPETHLENYKINLLQNSNQQWQLWITPCNQPLLNLKSCLALRAQVGKQAGCIVQDKEKNFMVSGWNNLWHMTWPTELDTPQINQIVILHPIQLSSLQETNSLLYRKGPLAGKSIITNNFSTDLKIEKNKIIFENKPQVSEFYSQQLILSNDLFNNSKVDYNNISFYTRLLPGDNNHQKKFLQLHKFLFYYLEYDTSKNRIFSWLPIIFKKDKKQRFEFRYPQITSQINPFWNKFPNFEYNFIGKEKEKKLQQFSNHMCNEFTDKNNHHKALGRMFSIREKNTINNFKLFICAADHTGKNIEAHPWVLYANHHKTDKINSKHTIDLNLDGFFEELADGANEKYFNFLKDLVRHLIIIEKIFKQLPDSRDNLLKIIQEDDCIKTLNIKKEYLESYYDFLINSSIKNIDIDPIAIYQKMNNPSSENELEQFIDILQKYPDDLDSDLSLILKNIFLKLSTDEEYECFFHIKNKIPKIIGLSLPDEIGKHDIETAEEVLSLLIILSNKIVDTHNSLIAKRKFLKKFWRSIINLCYNKTHEKMNAELEELNQSISDLPSDNPRAKLEKILPVLNNVLLSDKENLIPDFISYYNKEDNSGNIIELFKKSGLRELIEKTKAVHDSHAEKIFTKTLNDSIYEVVNEHFRNSQVIKIKYF